MPEAGASDQVSVELARAEELVEKGESWQALTELWEARNVAPRDPAVLATILEKLNNLAFRGAFERDRFVDDEVATAASESISGLTSRLESDIEFARKSRVRRSLTILGEVGLSALAAVVIPVIYGAVVAAGIIVAVARAIRRLIGRPEPDPSSILGRLDRWVAEKNEALP